MKDADFFNWLKTKQSNGKLTQIQVDGMNELLTVVKPVVLKDSLSKLNGWTEVTPTNSKKLSKADIIAVAKSLGVEPSAMKAVIDVEAAGEGFDKQGRPTILFEPHIFWRELTKINYITKRNELRKSYPGILSPKWDKNLYKLGNSYDKLSKGSELHWEAAHNSCSWGLGQIMGFNATKIGYPTLKEFIDDMYKSEAKQLKAMAMFLKANGLISKLKAKDWAGFARGYNGSGYAVNKYDTKLASAYTRAKKNGW